VGRPAEPRPDQRMRTRRSCRRPLGETLLWYPDRARWCGLFSGMPNIKQQKKRVRIAAEERLENLRYRSTIKTLTKRLATAREAGDDAAVESEHRSLVKLIDRAVSRGALHRNAAARKKSQAAKLAAGPDS
jgi:small subunit ribosomal protein S20